MRGYFERLGHESLLVKPEPLNLQRVPRGVEPDRDPPRRFRRAQLQNFHRGLLELITVAFASRIFEQEPVAIVERVGDINGAGRVAGKKFEPRD